MPRKDKHHNAVRNALVKDGWDITDDPFTVKYQDVNLFADLAAEKALAAEKGTRKIIVEIKVFGGVSLFSELEKAVGQFIIYRDFLDEIAPARELFLAVAQHTYDTFFQRPSVQKVVASQRLKLLIFAPAQEEITQWIN